ncbi:Ribonuclease Z beta-lactamase superfamily hydrolase [Methanonatronarchaeum thermophilum]|uniref:Ribonuclease Z n=1 Tax=Methanonatronarchaeum thermophilum TaxID=1927129 RepID=A0A1Y3GDR6_9EURY|nr:ribonuclease Z [Methanonatronarchaeum thermophilum]OUJ19367.1 Ribonuclease Z beta-lactamase superfamily hydrolase [Methanonatronarchaeum thermophilum]
MPLDVIFLGTAGATPTVERNPPAVMIKREDEMMLFDCGEGTQRQMMKARTGMFLDRIYITHFHADHFLGIPGMIQTLAFQGREKPLEIVGPEGTENLIKAMAALGANTPSFNINLKEVVPGQTIDYGDYKINVIKADHGRKIQSLAYVLQEKERPGRFNREKAIDLGVQPGPDFGKLQKGQTVNVEDRTIKPEMVLGPPRRGRKIVYTGDTRPNEKIRSASKKADLLIHDGTFTSKDKTRAIETKHTTAIEAASIAKKADVEMLALTHLSSRYSKNYLPLLKEAKRIFQNTIVPRDLTELRIPFPEKNRDIEVKGL